MSSWPHCEDLRQDILQSFQVVVAARVTRRLLAQAQHKDDNKHMALTESVAHHLHISSDDIEKEAYFIHRHHFSAFGWKCSQPAAGARRESNGAESWATRHVR